MPFTTNQGARIYWDEEGQGEPLLLIMGGLCVRGLASHAPGAGKKIHDHRFRQSWRRPQ